MNEELERYVSIAESLMGSDPTLTGADALLRAIELVRHLALLDINVIDMGRVAA